MSRQMQQAEPACPHALQNEPCGLDGFIFIAYPIAEN
jgi:hypothetical protein